MTEYERTEFRIYDQNFEGRRVSRVWIVDIIAGVEFSHYGPAVDPEPIL